MSSADGLIHLTIDGHEVAVPPTKVAYDPQFKKNIEVPTTVYDAALALSDQKKIPNPIPILCHREHVNPVAVCRVCVVDVGGRVLAPACYRAVEPGLKVQTRQTSERVRTAATMVTELLMADHPKPCKKHAETGDCELEMLAQQLGVNGNRLPGRLKERPHDNSSVVIGVDHNACILCDRCIRGCNEIKNNQVMGRMGKGYFAQIAFDLNAPMGDSTCVACGECMVSCPTGALTNLREKVATKWTEPPAVEPVSADELLAHPLFEGVSRPFLRFNEKAVVRRHFKDGDIICREGEFGATAFLIEKGKVEIFISAPIKHAKTLKNPRKGDKVNWGPFGLAKKFVTTLAKRSDDHRDEESDTNFIHIDAPVPLDYSNPIATLEAGDIFGEMTCMSNYPRSATVRADGDCTLLEMRRNVLYILQRNRRSREWLDQRYLQRAIDSHLRSVKIFRSLLQEEEQFNAFVNFLRPRVTLKRLPPGTVVFRQGDLADHFYLVRIGFVKVSQSRPGGEHVLNYVGPGGYFGEIGLMTALPELRGLTAAGLRTATCSSLDHVDLVQIAGDDFLAVLDRFPRLREHLAEEARRRLEENRQQYEQTQTVGLGNFLDQGLMNAQSLLVLDLQKCTRCDECTKACADSHDGVTRLIREGLRFDHYLVTTSCRSCLDPYCLVGCPVDSIHRRGSREIIIEDWCIGCGLCASNCPYGNINMHGFDTEVEDPAHPGRKIAAVQQKATLCDLCTSLDGQPSCVYACPHDAAHRMTGPDLLRSVTAGRTPTSDHAQ